MKKPSVLVVDDEQLIASTLAEILNFSGFEAEAVFNGGAALQRLGTRCPDALITDVIMPGTNGIEVAIYARRQCPNMRILLLSGQAATTELLRDAHLSGHDFELLAKPLPPEILLSKLRD